MRPTVAAEVSDIDSGDDWISFSVEQVGTPVVVKASYFPNWEAEGAEGPYRITPNLMVVVPTSTDVRLVYGTTEVEWLGWVLTLAGLAGVVLLARAGPLALRPARARTPGAGRDATPEGEPSAGAHEATAVSERRGTSPSPPSPEGPTPPTGSAGQDGDTVVLPDP